MDEVGPSNPVGEAWAVLIAAMDKWRLPVLNGQLAIVPEVSSPYRAD